MVWRAPREVLGQVTPRGEMEDLGRLDRLDEVDRVELGAVGWDWTWETCRGQQRDYVTLRPIHTGCVCSVFSVLDDLTPRTQFKPDHDPPR